METIQAPKDCEDCNTNCPLKKTGCAFDLAKEVIAVKHKLVDAGVPAGMEGQLEALNVVAKSCRENMVLEISEYNKEVKLAARVAAIMESGRVPVKTETAEWPQQGISEGEATKAPSKRKSRGDPSGYVSEADRETEEQILAAGDPEIFGMCVMQRTRLENAEAVVDELAPFFNRPPLKGLIAAIRKVHRKDPKMCRITVYYRGPPVREATELLKEWKEERKNEQEMETTA